MNRLIHQIWVGSEIPERFKKRSNEIERLNPEYQMVRWDQEALINEYPEIKEFFDLECVPGFISNWARFRILNKYGGWYMDYDYEPFTSLDELLKDSNAESKGIIAAEFEMHGYNASNGFIYMDKGTDTSSLYSYVPDVPAMGLFNEFLVGVNHFVIPSKFVSTKGTYYKEERMRSFYGHKNFQMRLVRLDLPEHKYKLIHKDKI